jgi:hypothetical protein
VESHPQHALVTLTGSEGYAEDRVFVPPLAVSADDLEQSITAAVATADWNMLRSARIGLHYRTDICRVTKASHLEHTNLKTYTIKSCKYSDYVDNTLVSIKR